MRYQNSKSRKEATWMFQHTLFVEIRTLVTLLKSTLLLKMKCRERHIYMKTEFLPTI